MSNSVKHHTSPAHPPDKSDRRSPSFHHLPRVSRTSCSNWTRRLCLGHINFTTEGFRRRWWLRLQKKSHHVCLSTPPLLVLLHGSTHCYTFPSMSSWQWSLLWPPHHIYQPIVTESPFIKLIPTSCGTHASTRRQSNHVVWSFLFVL